MFIFRIKYIFLMAIISLAFFGSGVKCLRDSGNNTPSIINNTAKLTQPPVNNTSTPVNTINSTPVPTRILSQPEQAAVDAAKKFIYSYTNYKEGDYSNWDELNLLMTQTYQKNISEWLANKRKEAKKQPIKYIYHNSIFKRAYVMKNYDIKMEIKIEVEQEDVYGTVSGNPDKNGPTSIWVDENGNPSSYENIVRKTFTKNYYLVLLKDANFWKVDSVTEGN